MINHRYISNNRCLQQILNINIGTITIYNIICQWKLCIVENYCDNTLKRIQ